MGMKIIETELDGVVVIEPIIFNDQRGYFFETYQRLRYADAGIVADFVQDNLSFSKKGTLFVCSVILLCFITSAVIFTLPAKSAAFCGMIKVLE